MKVRVVGLAMGLALVIGLQASVAMAAPAAKTEVTGSIIYATDTLGGWNITAATGSVVVNGNNWNLVMTGEAPVALDHAVVLDPISSGYFGGCAVNGLPPTQDWHSVTTPNGMAKLVCHGDMP